MAESVVQSGSFGTDSVLIVGAAEFGNTVELRWAFTVTANPNGFVARVVSVFDPDSGGAGFLISGTGVHNLILGQFPAGQYSFQIEPQGGIVAASSFTILERDPNE